MSDQIDDSVRLLDDLSSLLLSKKPKTTTIFSKRRKKTLIDEARSRRTPIQMIPVHDFSTEKRKRVPCDVNPFEAIESGDLQALRTWIMSNGENSQTVNHVNRNTGRTMLQEAAACGREDVVRLLLRYPFLKVNKCSTLGKTTALHIASQEGFNNIVRAIMYNGGDIHARNKLGEQPIHLAADKFVIQTLVAGGANLFSKTKAGLTCSQYVATRNDHELYDFLQTQITQQNRQHKRNRLEIQARRKEKLEEARIRHEKLALEEKKQKERALYLEWREGRHKIPKYRQTVAAADRAQNSGVKIN